MSGKAKYVGLALVGGVVGAVVGLLFAPASGRETRRRLGEEKDALLREGQRTLGQVSGYVQDQVAEGRRRLARAVSA